MRARLLLDVARLMGAELRGARVGPPVLVRGAGIDSRAVAPGDLFFALSGRNTHGARFASDAFARGACGVVTAQDLGLSGAELRVSDPARALAQLAERIRAEESARLPAAVVTGSVGKTTTCRYVSELLAGTALCHRPPASFNNHLGVPLTILGAPAEAEFLVVEVGSSAPGEVLPLARWARPVVACVTAVAPAHMAGFGNMEGVAREKLSILKALPPQGEGWIPVGVARTYGRFVEGPARVRTFGTGGDLEIVPNNGDGSYTLRFGRDEPPMRFRWRPPFPHSVTNLEAAVAIVAGLGIPPEALLDRIERLTLPPLRGECRMHGGVDIVLDCYNSNPVALRSSVEQLEREAVRGRRVCVIGTMEELGVEERSWHQTLGTELARARLDAVYFVGRARDWYLEGLRAGGRDGVLMDAGDESATRLAAFLRPGDRVLFKASRAEHLEQFAAKVAQLLDERSLAGARGGEAR